MIRRPQDGDAPAISSPTKISSNSKKIGLVLSGGGSRAAYQVGALKALVDYMESEPNIVVGSSIGAVNTLVFSAALKGGLRHAVNKLEEMWIDRTFKNSFRGSPSKAFLKSLKMALLKYATKPGPEATTDAIFDPTPMMEAVDKTIYEHGGLEPENRASCLKAVAVMTTLEGAQRKPILILSSKEQMPPEDLIGASFEVHHVKGLTAKHGFASAALPSVLPPVELNLENRNMRFVDGGISQNIPVDPAVRLGAEKVIIIDISGRDWWFRRYGEALDTRPEWEVPAALQTYCVRPPEVFTARCQGPLGPILKAAIGGSTRNFIHALGPTWPVFTFIKAKFGEEIAYEVLSYVTLYPEYTRALIETGYNETMATINKKHKLEFEVAKDYKKLVAAL